MQSYAYFTAYIDFPKLSTTVSRYGSDNVTVTLEWLPGLEVEVSYDISVVPAPLDRSMFNRTSLQATVSYNILYNVSVVASHCHLQNTTIIEFKFGKTMNTCNRNCVCNTACMFTL